jgi:hypothetical protein
MVRASFKDIDNWCEMYFYTPITYKFWAFNAFNQKNYHGENAFSRNSILIWNFFDLKLDKNSSTINQIMQHIEF